ncbi:hypothetical protein [Anaerosinus gibii]|uniref:Uncharacterized protein n=1 Tax=Selenobaculum gibii TaxID=3054208 RepID=A0A9Y2AHN1_9FIRM|nr:hypothetical protein [Selenobaculum gbiensis]WIW69853.1 hypothetical protein P3F81_07965 [Selenobaculum gbiensis]
MIKGYNRLNEEEKKIFNNFKTEFLRVNDSTIEFIAVLQKWNYIRVDFRINSRNEWLHITPYGLY